MKVLLRLDDLGLNRATNEAVGRCLRETDLLLNLGVLAIAGDASSAVEILRPWEACSVGVHATINCEWPGGPWKPASPASRISKLLDEGGRLFPVPRDLLGRDVGDAALREVRAQIEALRALGLRPQYLDTHMFFGARLGLDKALEELAGEESLVFDNPASFHHVPSRQIFGCDDPSCALSDAWAKGGGRPLVVIFHPMFEPAAGDFQIPDQMVKPRLQDARWLLDGVVSSILAETGGELFFYRDFAPAPWTAGTATGL